jgi:hypothetical protein
VENKERNINLYLAGILPVGFCVLFWSVFTFPVERINAGLIALSVVTVFL